MYSTDDVNKTRADVGRQLEEFGVIVEGTGFTYHGGHGSGGNVPIGLTLKCRVDEARVDPLANLALKPLRFRVEFSDSSFGGAASAPHCQSHILAQNLNSDDHKRHGPMNAAFLAAPHTNANVGRARASILMNKNIYQPSSPYIDPNAGDVILSPQYLSAVVLVHEKGSMTTFKAIWRKVKEVCGDASAPACLSPTIGATPVVEHAQRFAL